MKTVTDNIKPILAFLVVIMGFAYFFFITFIDVKADPQVLMVVVSLMTITVSYYFGSSTGAAKKDETINNLVDKNK